MSEETETSSDDPGESRITVSRMASAIGTSSRDVIRAVTAALQGRDVCALNVAIVDDATIADLHERYMDDPSPTDVLAFDLRDDAKGETIEGEIVISADTARRQAAELGVDVSEELLRYVIHGTLHLMGYKDDTSAHRTGLRQAEDRVLNGLRSAGRTVETE